MFIKSILYSVLNWFTKANILAKNIKKISIPDNTSQLKRVAGIIGMTFLEILLSWINVLVMIWQIITTIFESLRELFISIPEDIKVLRFPLRNNPYLDRESVWAYVTALDLKSGNRQPDRYSYKESMDLLSEHYPSFNRVSAVRILEGLNVLTPDLAIMFKEIANPIFKDDY